MSGSPTMFRKVLIANRGEIACRIMKTARRMGVRCIAVYSDADKSALHVDLADEAYRLGPSQASQSYLAINRIIAIARRAGAEAIHPGYGFLSENPAFAEACREAGVVFIGPPVEALRTMGLKENAKRLMERAGVPVIPGYHGERTDADFLHRRAHEIGYPVLIKASAAGGGRGMRRVDDPVMLAPALEAARREAEASFGNGHLLIEKFLPKARHIEFQVFADAHGRTIHLFERDCSLQRRHQKVIEEAPAHGMTPQLRRAMGEVAIKAATAIGYLGAGTVEFLADISDGLRADRFFFMEMNTRLQVEHPVTEAITGLDLVEWQLRIAAGEPLPKGAGELTMTGHAIEARIYAEDPAHDFLPATGKLVHLHFPDDGVRVDTGFREGDEISPHYDPLLAKIIVHAPSREAALVKLSDALRASRAVGCATNLAFIDALAAHPDVIRGNVDTGLIERELAALTPNTKPSMECMAIAALASLGFLDEREGPNPFATLMGWRAWGEDRHFTRLLWRDQSIEMHVVAKGQFAFSVEGATGSIPCALVARRGDHVRVEFGDRIVDAVVVVAGKTIGIFLDGSAQIYTRPDPLSAKDEDHLESGCVTAPITGLVTQVSVAGGDRVLLGAPLLAIEAMKMEHIVRAPLDGVINEILVAPGDRVEQGADLLRLVNESG
jgi:3-methylcrotonyl-CoA carboxylase alpha subunit